MVAAASAIDWNSDNGDGNSWDGTTVARRSLYFSLQAGAAAHLSLKERMAGEVPWVKASTRSVRIGTQV